PLSTLIEGARMVTSPVCEVRTAPFPCTTTGPVKTFTPSSCALGSATSSDVRMQVALASSQPLAQLLATEKLVPIASHFSTLPPLQRVELGVQPPVQSPSVQLTGHWATNKKAVPLPLQTSTLLPLHLRPPGVHCV